ncbi:DUF637 domain-containing protein [Edwardsiella hoshinae]|uniref:Possible hemagglutinin (DUF637) n=1 Tax=Edwardsiella hoshinae TaxID=93378 RepID=A0A376D7S2_9GAMM|nr:DUF637 domain-containing protein [Edwardsiella hoshinae]QPR28181.1 DUF637 domain-containing protein [Edwardsiella hoshinae]STC84525.1 Possible hemagglutinin (DUF637) [Edwardsiella hoshinae]
MSTASRMRAILMPATTSTMKTLYQSACHKVQHLENQRRKYADLPFEIRDPTAQQALTGKRVDETVASLNRDVFTGRAGANALKPIFNEQEIKAGFEIVGALQRETGTFLNNRAREATAARLALEQELARPEGERDPARLAALQQQVTDSAVWAPGGTGRQVLTALAAAAGGNVIGSTSQFAQNMLINYVQQQGASYIGKLVKEGSLIEGSPLHATLHAIVACAGSAASKQDCGSGALGAAASSLLTNLFNDTPDDATPEQKEAKRNLLTSLVSGIALAGGQEVATAVNSALSAVENNFLGATSSDKLDKAVEKIMNGDKSLATANELIKLENADKRSDALVSKFIKDPAQLTRSERAELAGYLRIYASEMEKEYGPAVSQELVNGLLSGQDYMKRNPDSEAMAKAQSIMNTWGYHKSNASIGDAPLMFGSSVLGTTIKEGMALNAAIGVVVNTGVQFGGDDPFSYVDAIMAGVTAAATTGKGWQASAAINMGGAAISSAIKGEDLTNAAIGAGVGSVSGGIGGTVIKGAVSTVAKDSLSDLIGATSGAYLNEKAGDFVKDTLNEKDKKNVRK